MNVGSEATTQPEAGNIHWFSFIKPNNPLMCTITMSVRGEYEHDIRSFLDTFLTISYAY